MKQSLLLAFALYVSTFYAQQRITVIDKSQENTFLFDETNPQSLVSLFNNNSLPFNPMSLGTSIRLANEGLMENKPFKVKRQSNIALSTKDGEDSMAMVNGVLQFVYPMPDFYYTDLQDISRILLYEHDTISNGKAQYLIDSIGYAKKYNPKGKFELLGTISYSALSTDYKMFYLEEFKNDSFQKLLNSGFLKDLKSEQLMENPLETKPLLTWNSTLDPSYFHSVFDKLQTDRPKIKNSLQRNYNWPISSVPCENRLSDLEKRFGSGKIHGIAAESNNIPFSNIDGEDSMAYDNGNLVFVYPETEFYISWIDVRPAKAWSVYSVSSETLTPKNKLERILFTNSENELLADFNCSDPRIDLYAKYLKEAGIQLEVPVQENWKTALLKARLSGKKYAVSKKGDLKKLAKEFEVMEDVVH